MISSLCKYLNLKFAEAPPWHSFAGLTHLYCIWWRLLPSLVDTHGHIDGLRAVLVAHKDAVFPRILHGDVVDRYAAALGLLGDDELALVEDLPVVPQPEDLRSWFAVKEAGQTQRLRTGGGTCELIQT